MLAAYAIAELYWIFIIYTFVLFLALERLTKTPPYIFLLEPHTFCFTMW